MFHFREGSRLSRLDNSKHRTPSLPSIGSKLDYEHPDRRSRSLIHSSPVIPDIVKHGPSARVRDYIREGPVDDEDPGDGRLEDLLSPHPDDHSESEGIEAYETISRSGSVHRELATDFIYLIFFEKAV